MPTVLGNCACYTTVVAVYEPDRAFKRVGYIYRMPLCAIVDYRLLPRSPMEYMKEGITDTLAKWYEAIAVVENTAEEYSTTVDMGLAAAKICRDALLQFTEGAIRAMKTQEMNNDFKRVVDTIFAIAGSVGGFAGECSHMAGTHAVHNGLAVVHECNEVLYGIKVGYGILVQLIVEGKTEQARALIDYYRDNGFAYNEKTLSVSSDFAQKKQALSEFAASDRETFLLEKPDLVPQDIMDAMALLEEMAQK